MMAPDLPLEPAPRNAFSRRTTRPGRRRASARAMLVPITPPPIMRTSQLTAIARSFRAGTEQSGGVAILAESGAAEERDGWVPVPDRRAALGGLRAPRP